MKVKYIIPLMILSSCNLIDNQPKCSDEEVKKLALEIFKEKVKPAFIDEYINEHLNHGDLSEYAESNNLSYEAVFKKEKEKLTEEAEIHTLKVFKELKLEDILTSKIDKEINKCDCEANIKSQSLKEIEAYYSAQLNDEKKLHVELLYKVKE